jgi:hypothetical protein
MENKKLCNFIFDLYDDLLLEGEIAFVNKHLFGLDVNKLSLQTSICILSVTNPWKDKLPNRSLFWSNVYNKVVNELTPDRHNILDGLK